MKPPSPRPLRLRLALIFLLVRPFSQETTATTAYIPPLYSCSPSRSSCTLDAHECLANPNHPQATSDLKCLACSSDQTYWPCNVDGLCYCRDRSRPKIPPAPSIDMLMLQTAMISGNFKMYQLKVE